MDQTAGICGNLGRRTCAPGPSSRASLDEAPQPLTHEFAPMDAPKDLRSIDTLIAIMARLREPERGCPWDLEQKFATIAPYTIEEAYEVAEAIARDDMAALKDELGDLLFQTVFH